MSFRFRTGAIDIGQPVNRSAALNRGLVSWWLAVNQGPFYGGATFRDLCGLNHGTLTNGPTWGGSNGRPGGFGSLYFTLTSGAYVNLGTGVCTALNSSTYTISGWVKFVTGAGSGNRNMFFGANGTTGARQLALDWQTAGKITAGEENISFILDSATSLTAGVWYHVAWTYSSGDSFLYLNGKQDATTFRNNTGSYSSSYYLSDHTGASHETGGPQDDIRVYSRALSGDEIYGLYADSIRGYPGTLNWLRRTMVFDTSGAAPSGNRRRRVICGAA